MSEARMRAAKAIHTAARKHVDRRQSVLRSQVVNVEPLQLELLGGDLILDIDDDFDLTVSLKTYVDDVGLQQGDTVLLHHEQGTYLAFDAVAA
ncbi:MAG: hypothetical protein ABW167_19510 [Baekduia sp.]